TAPDPNLVTFDCPDASMSIQARDRSNTPLQALASLQNEVFHEAAQALARRVLETDLPSDEARIDRVFAWTVGRAPDGDERQVIGYLLADAREEYATAEAETAALVVGDHAATGVSAAESAAWVATARILLNLDEFLTRE
ncbi:MAG: DUF1553 domain-containing protein, partial [Verrucomicrobiae bacterium]|nr:DUF1553 domain-containing protein [Verrucomicrobiae bacterium]